MIEHTPLVQLLDDTQLRLTPNAVIKTLMGNSFSQREESTILNKRIDAIKKHSMVRGRNPDVIKQRLATTIKKLQQEKRQLIIMKKLLQREIADLKQRMQD